MKFRISLFLVVLVTLSAISFAVSGGLSSCTVFNSPGTYPLTGDVTGVYPGQDYCFLVNSSDVTIDCGPYSINDSGAGGWYGIQLADQTSNVTVQNCEIYDYGYGIYNSNWDYVNLSLFYNNTLHNDWEDIYVTGSQNMFQENTGYEGFNIQCGLSTIYMNELIGPDCYQFYIQGPDNLIIDNTVHGCWDHGFYINGAFNIIQGNEAYENDRSGFIIAGSANNISENVAHNNSLDDPYSAGMEVVDGKSGNIFNNTAYNNSNGFYFNALYRYNITDNYAYRNMLGIDVGAKTTESYIADNLAEENVYYDMIIAGNPRELRFNVGGCDNTVVNNIGSGGRAIYYANTPVNLVGGTYSEVILCNASGSTLDGVSVDGSDEFDNNGFLLLFSEDTDVINCNSNFNAIGFGLWRGDRTTFRGGGAHNNSVGYLLVGSYNVTLENLRSYYNNGTMPNFFLGGQERAVNPVPIELLSMFPLGAGVIEIKNAFRPGPWLPPSDDMLYTQQITEPTESMNTLYKNVDIFGNNYGMLLVFSSNVTIENSRIHDNSLFGVFDMSVPGWYGFGGENLVDFEPFGEETVASDSIDNETSAAFYFDARDYMVLNRVLVALERFEDTSEPLVVSIYSDNYGPDYMLMDSEITIEADDVTLADDTQDESDYVEVLYDESFGELLPPGYPLEPGRYWIVVQTNDSTGYNVYVYDNATPMRLASKQDGDPWKILEKNNFSVPFEVYGTPVYFPAMNVIDSEIYRNGDNLWNFFFSLLPLLQGNTITTETEGPAFPELPEGLIWGEVIEASWLTQYLFYMQDTFVVQENGGIPLSQGWMFDTTIIGNGPPGVEMSFDDPIEALYILSETNLPTKDVIAFEWDDGEAVNDVTIYLEIENPVNKSSVHDKFFLIFTLEQEFYVDQVIGLEEEDWSNSAIDHFSVSWYPWESADFDRSTMMLYYLNIDDIVVHQGDRGIAPFPLNTTIYASWVPVPHQTLGTNEVIVPQLRQEDTLPTLWGGLLGDMLPPDIAMYGSIYGLFAAPGEGDGDQDDGYGGRLSLSVEPSCEGNVVTVTNGDDMGGAEILVYDALTGAQVAHGYTNPDGEFVFEACGMTVKVYANKDNYSPDSTTVRLIDCEQCQPGECQGNDQCPESQQCVDNMCVPVECECGYVENHRCVEYACCSNADCPNGQQCKDHQCGYQCTVDSDCEATEYCNIMPGAAGGNCEPVQGQCGYPENHAWVQYECGDEAGCSECPLDKICKDHICTESELSCPETAIVGDDGSCDAKVGGERCEKCPFVVTDPTGIAYTGRTDENGSMVLPFKLQGTYKVALLTEGGELIKEVEVEVFPKSAPVEPEKPTEEAEPDYTTPLVLFLLALIAMAIIYMRTRGQGKKRR